MRLSGSGNERGKAGMVKNSVVDLGLTLRKVIVGRFRHLSGLRFLPAQNKIKVRSLNLCPLSFPPDSKKKQEPLLHSQTLPSISDLRPPFLPSVKMLFFLSDL